MNPQFDRDNQIQGKLGTHSILKCVTTFCRSRGETKDGMDYSAKWKAQRQQDHYEDTQLNWPDILAESKLWIDDICLCKPVDNYTSVTDEWLTNLVARRISNIFGKQVGTVFEKALLWAYFKESMVNVVPSDIKREVVTLFIQLQTSLPDETNPIQGRSK